MTGNDTGTSSNMNVLLIDNEDSFTYNIVDILRKIETVEITIIPSDNLSLDDANKFDKIIISPGPGLPDDFPVLKELFSKYKASKPILGICLGLQAICSYFGAGLINLPAVHHGQSRRILVTKRIKLFRGIPDEFLAGLYHSWIVNEKQFPGDLDITAVSENGYIMAVSHKKHDIHGLQFHPESFLCEYGSQIIKNFISE